MKIFVYKSDHVDLEAPIKMTDEQRDKFIDFFKKMFPGNVNISNKLEMTKSFGTVERSPKTWEINEYLLIVGPKDNLEIAELLDRTEMSVGLQRGSFVPEFFEWLKEKGYAQSNINKNIIKEFLREIGRL